MTHGAERLLAAERGTEKIAVEIKSFLASTSTISQFHMAMGQFINYRAALRREDADRLLYLAVPDLTYNTFFQLDFPALMIQENSIKLIDAPPQRSQICLTVIGAADYLLIPAEASVKGYGSLVRRL